MRRLGAAAVVSAGALVLTGFDFGTEVTRWTCAELKASEPARSAFTQAAYDRLAGENALDPTRTSRDNREMIRVTAETLCANTLSPAAGSPFEDTLRIRREAAAAQE